MSYNLGDYVELKGKQKRKGYIRYDGSIDSVGDCYGIQLDTKDDTKGTDGSIDGQKYFQCKQGYGVFIKKTRIKGIINANTSSPPAINTEINNNNNNNKLMDLKPKHYQHNIYRLYQNDFKYGTYRITQSGKYIIMEDIEFDFNAGDINNPNFETPHDGAWWPHIDQIDKYPGAYTTRDEYFMGFFAGITIETGDVILDLNGYEIRMSRP
eukprot:148168_1